MPYTSDGTYIPDDSDLQSVVVQAPSDNPVYASPMNDPNTATYRSAFTNTPILPPDLLESLKTNVGAHSLNWLGADAAKNLAASFNAFQAGWGGVTGGAEDAPQAKPSDQQSSDQQSGGQKFLDTVTGGIKKSWDKDPSEILKLGFGAIGGAYRDQEVKRAAALRRQQELEDRAAFNESVKGLRQARKGIIQRALKRTDGSVVFDAHGNLIKG